MTKGQKRRYEKIDDAEIDLVIQCSDSHEFYERYRQAFPTRKKGIDSIGKIWKRRGEFLKKRQGQDLTTPIESGAQSLYELEALLLAQNKILTEHSLILKELLKVSREIFAQIQIPDKSEDPPHRYKETQTAEKEPVRKIPVEKPNNILIGS